MTAPRRFRLTAPVAPESSEQACLFQWAAFSERSYPELRLLFAIPNGTSASSMAEAVKAKSTGRKRGVPDCCLPVARHGKHGFYVELKRKGATAGSVRKEQQQWLADLTAQGYLAVVAYGWEEAKQAILDYLSES